MIFSKHYDSKTAELAVDWSIGLLIDIDSQMMLASETSDHMRKFNGFLAHQDIEPMKPIYLNDQSKRSR